MFSRSSFVSLSPNREQREATRAAHEGQDLTISDFPGGSGSLIQHLVHFGVDDSGGAAALEKVQNALG